MLRDRFILMRGLIIFLYPFLPDISLLLLSALMWIGEIGCILDNPFYSFIAIQTNSLGGKKRYFTLWIKVKKISVPLSVGKGN